MSDTQNPTTDNTSTNNCNSNCCANTDGRNVVNICAGGNTLYIGCMPACNTPCEENSTDSGTAA